MLQANYFSLQNREKGFFYFILIQLLHVTLVTAWSKLQDKAFSSLIVHPTKAK